MSCVGDVVRPNLNITIPLHQSYVSAMATPTRRGITPRPSSGIPTRMKAPSSSRKPIPAPKFTPSTPTLRPTSGIFGIPPTEADLGLVDWQNVQDADISADLSIGDITIEASPEDKVLVSVRYVLGKRLWFELAELSS